jgi:adenylate cyclase
MPRLSALLAELKRRRVFQVAVVYAAAAVAVAQAADVFLPRLGLPDWTVTVIVAMAVAGFPAAILLAWIFDITPGGVTRTPSASDGDGVGDAGTPRESLAGPSRTRLLGGGAAGLVMLVGGGWWLSTVALRPTPVVERLAVLPLANLSDDAGQLYFARGMHDALITELARAGVPVIARASVLHYEQLRRPAREIARELNVGALVDGSVLHSGDSVRIHVQLIDGRTEAHLWADTYYGAVADVIGMHRDVTRAVVERIRKELTPEIEARLSVAPSVDPAAYDAYLRGLDLLEQGTIAGREAALHWFERAVQLDPTFTDAYLGTARVWLSRRQLGSVPVEVATPPLRAALRAALELDEDSPDAQYALASDAAWADWNWVAAEAGFRRALQLNPNHADASAFYAHLLLILKRPDEALAHMRRGLALDPLNPRMQALACGAFNMARQGDVALGHCREALRLAPGSVQGFIALSNALHGLGRYDEAFAAERDNARTGRGDHELDAALAAGWNEGGYTAAMRRAAELLAARQEGAEGQDMRIARYFLRAGEPERALEWLERAFAARNPTLSYISTGIRDFDSVRSHPRYLALLRRMGLPE